MEEGREKGKEREAVSYQVRKHLAGEQQNPSGRLLLDVLFTLRTLRMKKVKLGMG